MLHRDSDWKLLMSDLLLPDLFLFRFCIDVDECSTGANDCDDNARCNNTIGRFECECLIGFSGDGTNCDSKCGALYHGNSNPISKVSLYGIRTNLFLAGYFPLFQKCAFKSLIYL